MLCAALRCGSWVQPPSLFLFCVSSNQLLWTGSSVPASLVYITCWCCSLCARARKLVCAQHEVAPAAHTPFEVEASYVGQALLLLAFTLAELLMLLQDSHCLQPQLLHLPKIALRCCRAPPVVRLSSSMSWGGAPPRLTGLAWRGPSQST